MKRKTKNETEAKDEIKISVINTEFERADDGMIKDYDLVDEMVALALKAGYRDVKYGGVTLPSGRYRFSANCTRFN